MQCCLPVATLCFWGKILLFPLTHFPRSKYPEDLFLINFPSIFPAISVSLSTNSFGRTATRSLHTPTPTTCRHQTRSRLRPVQSVSRLFVSYGATRRSVSESHDFLCCFLISVTFTGITVRTFGVFQSICENPRIFHQNRQTLRRKSC
jgi:hypothetical protein